MAHSEADEQQHDDGQPATFPPEPAGRHITPAPEDFANPPRLTSLLWPVFWIAAIGIFWAVIAAHPADSYFEHRNHHSAGGH